MRWWQRSLVGRFIVFILAALIAGQAIAFWISTGQREAAVRQTIQSDFISRTTALSHVLDAVPPDVRRTILIASSTGYARFWLTDQDPTQNALSWYETAKAYLSLSVEDLARSPSPDPKKPMYGGITPQSGLPQSDVTDWQRVDAEFALGNANYLYFSGYEGMGVVGRLDDGTWLNAAYYKPTSTSLWSSQSLLSVGITAIVLSLIGILVARQIARPLQQLTVSAEALGRGEAIRLTPPAGPDDIRRLYEAFDRMQIRLHRFVDDRTRMLAAIGHDLRTPLTILRLRAEFIADPAVQAKILATVDEMQAITEATLTFAKNEATQESTRTIDIAALLASLCDDLAELGHKVEFKDSERISYRCRPDNLKRAIRNLIENALRYAGSATVAVERHANALEITVEDHGPGIPPDETNRVFEPFYRLESSRNRESGGVGLGLSITRAIARQHGGDVTLSPNEPGLRAVVSLPVE